MNKLESPSHTLGYFVRSLIENGLVEILKFPQFIFCFLVFRKLLSGLIFVLSLKKRKHTISLSKERLKTKEEPISVRSILYQQLNFARIFKNFIV